jgi:hypothetical protein
MKTRRRTTAFYHFTLCRRDAVARVSPRVVVQASPIPVTASSEWRASAEIRGVSAGLVERFPALESFEALCRFAGEEAAPPTAGLVLWDRRFHLWMALFDDKVCLSVATELLEGNPIERVRAAQEYGEFLSAAGYDVLFDHQDGRLHSEGTCASHLAERIAAGGYSRWFRRMVRGCGLGLFFGSGIGLLGPILLRTWPHGATNARLSDGVLAVALGASGAAFQYWVTRKGLKHEVQQIRDAILSSSGQETRLVFHESAVIMAVVVCAILLFGSFASMAFASGNVLPALCLGAFCACGVVSVAAAWGRVVSLDGQAIQSQAHLDRTRRIAYEDVLQIVPLPTLDMWVVSSERERLVISLTCDLRGQLMSLLWDRVALALKSPAAEQPANHDEVLQRLREAIEAARRSGLRIRDARSTPLWMMVRRRDHPLRPQYSCHRRLLREGRVTMARVLTANKTLFGRPWTSLDAPVVVIYSDADGTPSLESLDRIAERFSDSSDREAAEWYREAFAANGGFPLQLPVPPSLAGGHHVYCTTLMVVRHQIPLGSLRARWLPLLVIPSMPFTMVVPMRLWGVDIRDQWRRGR